MIDMAGRVCGRLIVIAKAPDSPRTKKKQWLCRCVCGTEKVVCGVSLRSGNTKSCGCLQRSVTWKHGAATRNGPKKVYNVWSAMLHRCNNPGSQGWPYYGGRGIGVCERWKKFENFLADMGEPPKGLSIERIDNDGNYEPTNCRWATRKDQSLNTRRKRVVLYDGKSWPLVELAKRSGLWPCTLQRRIKLGWPIQEAVETPMKKRAVAH